ncbi:MAG: hypothetical protein KIT20_11930 [Alphaproteobacteria bacterium]|nr:hypothetical protein [Alphaproteobacteria bacterium]
MLGLVVASLSLSGLLLAAPQVHHAAAAPVSHAGFHADCDLDADAGGTPISGHQHDQAGGDCCLAAGAAGLPPVRRIAPAIALQPSPALRPDAPILAFDISHTPYRPPSRLA